MHVEVRAPCELEAEVGLTDGNIFQGALTFDQLLFNRPGGGVMGAPGRNAAAEILRSLKRPSGMSDAYAIF